MLLYLSEVTKDKILFLRLDVNIRSRCMVKCPHCSEEVAEPDKSLKNNVFCVESYTCKNCSHRFKMASQSVFVLNEKLYVHLM